MFLILFGLTINAYAVQDLLKLDSNALAMELNLVIYVINVLTNQIQNTSVLQKFVDA